uniref:CBS domain-containing protein n=1 Tax=Angiostrongylus cantonensis TaxID=6313 RepID=A0A158PAX9_ANGCA
LREPNFITENERKDFSLITVKRYQGARCLPTKSLYQNTTKQLNIGTWKGIHVLYPHNSLIDCLDILLNMGVSSVPVVEHLTLRRACAVVVSEAESFYKVVYKLVGSNVHRAFIIISSSAIRNFLRSMMKAMLKGIVSISDVMKAVVLEPGSHLNSYCISHRRFFTIVKSFLLAFSRDISSNLFLFHCMANDPGGKQAISCRSE